MKDRKRFFDDRIFYEPETNRLWVGRPDYKVGGKPWTWFIRTDDEVIRPIGKPPDNLIEIAREPEQTICNFWQPPTRR